MILRMSEDLLLSDLRRAATWRGAILRIANDSGEHLFAGYKQLGPYGLPHQPRVHLSIAPGGQRVMWQKGNGMDLFMHLMDWATEQSYRLRLDYERMVDESGSEPQVTLTVLTVEPVARARARDPLSALLRALVLADDKRSNQTEAEATQSYGVWSGFKME